LQKWTIPSAFISLLQATAVAADGNLIEVAGYANAKTVCLR
jgi:hypothetical protein